MESSKDADLLIRENSWLARIAAWKLSTGSAAIVMGNTIHLYKTSRAAFLQDERWVRHERCHLQQFREYGCRGFLIRYLWESIRKGYTNNRFEVEARAAEDDLY